MPCARGGTMPLDFVSLVDPPASALHPTQVALRALSTAVDLHPHMHKSMRAHRG